MQRETPESLRLDEGGEEAPGRICDAAGCGIAGEYRAPRSRADLHEYYWFCIDHVRDYNRHWNFYAGMTVEEVEESIVRDTTWDRPTWPFGALRGNPARAEDHLRSAADGIAGNRQRGAGNGNGHHRTGPDEAQRRALDVFDLDPPVSHDELRARYKALVKRHHPDANGGDPLAEERLKIINEAYMILRDFVVR